MIHPSYTELLDVLSGQEDLDNSMLSRYTIIIRETLIAIANKYISKVLSTYILSLFSGTRY